MNKRLVRQSCCRKKTCFYTFNGQQINRCSGLQCGLLQCSGFSDVRRRSTVLLKRKGNETCTRGFIARDQIIAGTKMILVRAQWHYNFLQT